MDRALQALRKAIKDGDAAAFARIAAELEEPDVLSGETFTKVALTGFDFSGLDLSNTEWEDCLLERLRFENTNLEGAYLHGCTVVDANFAGAKLDGVSLEGCVVKRPLFAGCAIDGVEWSGTELVDAAFRDVRGEDVSFENVTFAGGLLGLRVESGSWTGVTLRDVDTTGLELGDVELERCLSNSETPPEGFDRLTGKRKRIG